MQTEISKIKGDLEELLNLPVEVREEEDVRRLISRALHIRDILDEAVLNLTRITSLVSLEQNKKITSVLADFEPEFKQLDDVLKKLGGVETPKYSANSRLDKGLH